MNPVPRDLAIKALASLEDRAFGNDKGSGEMYQEWAERQGLCPEWDGESPVRDEDFPPSIFELLVAVGVSPRDIVRVLRINPKCFPRRMCKAYGFPAPRGAGK